MKFSKFQIKSTSINQSIKYTSINQSNLHVHESGDVNFADNFTTEQLYMYAHTDRL